MAIFSVTLGIAAGICLGFGILYLFIGLRRKENKRLNLTSTIFALSYAGAVVTAVDIYAIPKIIVLSKDTEARRAALAAGADAFVIKGDPPKQLLVAFDRVSPQS